VDDVPQWTMFRSQGRLLFFGAIDQSLGDLAVAIPNPLRKSPKLHCPFTMRRLYQARDRIEAQFLLDFLDRHLITATMLGDYLSGAAGELPLDIYPTVWVMQDDDLPRAREILALFLEQPGSDGETPWSCPDCGEAVEAGFELCWNCGRHRE
jgi:hypothetical protein